MQHFVGRNVNHTTSFVTIGLLTLSIACCRASVASCTIPVSATFYPIHKCQRIDCFAFRLSRAWTILGYMYGLMRDQVSFSEASPMCICSDWH